MANSAGTGDHDSCGFVYVLMNPAMPGHLKIGRTGRLAEDRAHELSRTAVPVPFRVVHRLLTSRPRELERAVHAQLSTKRTDPRREFFSCTADEAIQAVESCARQVAGIGAWTAARPHLVEDGAHVAISLRRDDLAVSMAVTDPFHDPRWRPRDIWLAHSDRDWIELHGTADGSRVAAADSESDLAAVDPVPYLDRGQQVHNGRLCGREFLVPGERLVLVTREDDGRYASACFEARSHVQVIGRTHLPRMTSEGHPLLLSDADRDYPTGALPAVRAWLSAGPPREWGPRSDHPGFALPDFASRPSDPAEWLPQLKR